MLHQAQEELRRIPIPTLRDIEHDLVERAEKVYKARSPEKLASKYRKLLKPSKLKSQKYLGSATQLLPRIGDSRGKGSPLRGSPKFSSSLTTASALQSDFVRDTQAPQLKQTHRKKGTTKQNKAHCLDDGILESAEVVRQATTTKLSSPDRVKLTLTIHVV